MPTRKFTDEEIRTAFEDKIFYSPDGCWYWIGAVSTYGYGLINCRQRQVKAHRLSYMFYKGDPRNLIICHSCDNKLCVNPGHLFLGTNADNLLDYVNKFGKISTLRLPEIMKLSKDGLSQVKIARLFGVNQSYISYILRGKRRTNGQARNRPS